ncbi:flavin reductase family protein [Corynebacterium heidelbergense]|uniref:Flavin reductase n=1 Tax=Corynebacterium heidelbergense TaxID=2055947 RepID=A0A364V8A6_9CORY|nr:flavin reductase family protein [Corynebacterium heidelbergense]RAV32859.1 flavin reductase [Corynebacterium heidelbergense]
MTTALGTDLRTALAAVPTPIAAVAAEVDGAPVGMIVGSFVGLSLDPGLVSFSLQKTSTTWPQLRAAERLGISILTSDHSHQVRQLAGPTEYRFAGVNYRTEGDAIVLDGATTGLVGRLVSEFSAGDHNVAIVEVEQAHHEPHPQPLVYHGRSIATLGR